MIAIKPLSQTDSKWANKKIGQTALTLGRYGCTITCMAMLMDTTPDQLAKTLKFTADAKIIWSNNFGKFKFSFREYKRNDPAIIDHIKDPKKAVILEVNNKSHWVIPVAYFPPSGKNPTYLIADPQDGVYKNLDVYKNITGAAYFTIK